MAHLFRSFAKHFNHVHFKHVHFDSPTLTQISPKPRFLLAIETDATRYHGEHAARPRILADSDMPQLLAHLAADLEGLLPATRHCNIACGAALFDQTQVLRPGYPAFNDFSMQPEPEIPLGLLQLLPMTLDASEEILAPLALEMEHRFLEAGQVSAHTAKWLESAFEIRINHARFMTLMDLNAMFRLQLDHFGYLPLWALLDAAMNAEAHPLEVTLENGQVFSWKEGAVHTTFQTFDHWARYGCGKNVDTPRGKLAGAYAEWTRTIRQYLTTLSAHAVRLEFHGTGKAGEVLPGSYLIEESAHVPRPHCAKVTEHSFGDLGTVCVSVVSGETQTNYYPLRPQGLNDIQRAIREVGLDDATVAFPGTILFDELSRSLVAEPLSGRLRT